MRSRTCWPVAEVAASRSSALVAGVDKREELADFPVETLRLT